MVDVILFKPKFYDKIMHAYPPLGLFCLSALLRKNGYSVRIIDEDITSDWKADVLKEIGERPILVGVSSMTGQQIKYGLRFSKFVKDNSNVPVVWGGIHPSTLPRQTLENKNIDFVIIGEGEETITELVSAFDKKKDFGNILGLGFKRGKKIFINKKEPVSKSSLMGFLDYSMIDLKPYIQKRWGYKGMIAVSTSRGCPHKCKFCYNSYYNKSKWEGLGADEVIKIISKLTKKYEIDSVGFVEDNFFADKNRVEKICKGIIEKNIKIKWSAKCRIDYFSEFTHEFIDLLKKSGCSMLSLGVESGSDKVLRSIDKGITKDMVLKVNEKLIRNKINCNYFFMLGLPNETRKDRMETLELVYRLALNNRYLRRIYCALYTPYPGTPLFHESRRNGFKPPTNLEGWAEMYWEDTNLPWINFKEKKVLESMSYAIGRVGVDNGLIRKYFLFKLYLIFKFGVVLPFFEKNISSFFKGMFNI